MKISKLELLMMTESLSELELDEIYKSVAVPKYLKSLYKNIYEYIDDDDTIDFEPVDEVSFINRELYVNNDGVKVVRNYRSDLNSKVLSAIKVKLFVNGLVYEKEFHSQEQLIKLLNNNKFVQEKWQLIH
jgi:hypothetical protein